MDKLQEYLDGEYREEKEQYRSVEDQIKKVLPVFSTYDDTKGWDYQFCEKLSEIKRDKADDKDISTSTLSMMAFSMSVLFGNKLDLSDNKNEKIQNTNYFESLLGEEENCTYIEKYQKSIVLIFEEYLKNEEHFKSKTYGVDDPFTLTWVKHLIDLEEKNTVFTNHISAIRSIKDNCKTKVKDVFCKIYTDIEELSYSIPNSDSNPIEQIHTFPLLKVVQLYYSLKDEVDIDPKYFNVVKTTLTNRLHYYLSLSDIDNSNFDAAEMVFSLEGLLLLDDNRENFNAALLNRVFEVINKKQSISIYWRPLTPFVTDKKGFALLPLSVEIAMSLIRICRLLGKKGEELFTNNFQVFNKYTEWLKTRLTVATIEGKKYFGWCSEHVSKQNVIHLWETSQVLVYLVNFNDMLQKHIANKSLNYANLSIRDDLKFKSKNDELWFTRDPVNGLNIYKEIYDNYIDKGGKKKSILLYGPPGTGKTTIAKNIAKSKGWPLITITPSDFIANGADQVENKAKNIFKVLCEQKRMIVLFDEIDRLILDRDSKLYSDQGDMFQFMTPSMLVKINDLREKNETIFIISTNYAERIDPAIKRAGRIDNQYLVLPPDKTRRKQIIEEYVEKKCNDESKNMLDDTAINKLAQNTSLCTISEVNKIIEFVIKAMERSEVPIDLDKTIKTVNKPSLSLISYEKKLGIAEKDKPVQIPKKDFLYLAFLKICDGEPEKNCFEESEKSLLCRFLKSEYEEDNANFISHLEREFEDDKNMKTFAEACVKILNETTKVDSSYHKVHEELKQFIEEK